MCVFFGGVAGVVVRFTSSNRCFDAIVEDQPEFTLRCDDLEEDLVFRLEVMGSLN